ncbi:MAG: GNAT family N-acetyltransferase [Sphingomicrobium sp.]
MTIRLAVPGERTALEDLQRRASIALDDYRQQLEADPEAIVLPIEQIERGQVIVAAIEGRLAGFAAVIGDGSAAELDGLFVEPALWRRGVGSALIDAVVHEARVKGLSMTAVTANPTARDFYERCGFCVEGEVQTRFGPGLRMSR